MRGVRKAYNVGTRIETEVLHGIDLTVRAASSAPSSAPRVRARARCSTSSGLLDRPPPARWRSAASRRPALDDRALTRLRGHSIGFVFQYHHLITAFSALENVMMPMLGAAGFANPSMRGRAAALIADVGLTPWQDNLAGNLSGGQQQRVAIARALAMGPALLLADEPTGNLDTKSADEVFKLLRRFNADQGTTVLFVTHNAELARRCDKTIEVVDGRLRG
jgi:lipoprotein-releasing system ATP-binding protein